MHELEHIRLRPYDRRGLLNRLAPFGIVIPIIVISALVQIDPAETGYIVAAAVLLVGVPAVALLLPWHRLPVWFDSIPTLTVFGAVVCLNLALADPSNAFTPVILLPIFWIALYGTRPELAVAALLAFLVPVVPVFLEERYDLASEVQRGIMWAAATVAVGFTTQRIVESLRLEQYRVRQILEATGDAFVGMDERGMITEWNPAAERLFGWSRREAVTRTVAQLIIPPETRSAHEQGLARFVQADTGQSSVIGQRLELEAMGKEGNRFPIELALSAVRTASGWRFQAFLHDIADRKHHEQQLLRVTEQQRRLNDELRVADQMKSHFLAMASHELRTPLTAIAGFSDTMLRMWDELSDEDKHRFVSIIDMQSTRLTRLVNDLLMLSRIEGGKLEVRPEEVPVEQVVTEAVRAFADMEVTVRCPRDLLALADPHHLEQILVNYLSNARKYGSAPYAVEVQRMDEWISIAVVDHGDGVREEFVPQLFEKFTQAQPTTDEASSGLGLSIVRGLAEAQGGATWYEPGAPQGSRFLVRVPAAA